MKKVISVIISILAIGLCVGCSGAQYTSPVITSEIPWVAYRTFESEKCSYTVTNYTRDGEEVVATGTLTYELKRNRADGVNALTMNFSLTYNNSDFVSESYRGKTDKMESYSVFRDNNLAAVTTYKKAVLETEPDNSYEYNVNYVNHTADFESGRPSAEERQKSTLTFKDGTYYDNDYMYYYVRAFKGLGDGFSANMRIVNWYECFKNNKFKETDMMVSCAKTSSPIALDKALFDGFVAEDGVGKDEGTSSIGCFDININLSAVKAGPELHAMFSKCDFATPLGENTYMSKLIPLKYRTTETEPKSGHITHYTEYVLSSFECIIQEEVQS